MTLPPQEAATDPAASTGPAPGQRVAGPTVTPEAVDTTTVSAGPTAVSVVMPVRNESRHLEAAVRRVLDQDCPGPLEVIIAVGPSQDDTREIAERLATADERVRLVDNPTGRTPAGLNRAITASRHGIIVRVDGHGELGDGYIATAVETLARTGAANVGGIMDAQGRTPFEQAVAVAYTSRLGLGGSTFHLRTSPEGPADTVFLGSFRKSALEAVGGYDETLHRAQDWELNYRLRQAGELVWFTPAMRVTYRPRSTYRALARQFYDTGKWRREVVRRHPDTLNARYLAPPLAVLGVLVGLAAGGHGSYHKVGWMKLGWLAPIGYLVGVVVGAAALRRELPWQVRIRLPLVFVIMHMCWGLGFLAGLGDDRPAH
ncbi:glycosyltransferase family 2 protein [Raineyella sp. W15-4]|uniref:glycosyltransferase family 2 protein n=1 Tax=Raineyella sp. W15-4 TaxID=3081651 RepID=UPI002954C1EC|nr:glycosyltransferase family 2 protein [Raineyella sp. W15-4]WOQ17985.1 glycosyltransferase family 2 protein [Raineyella sp. W15-4]